MTLLPLGITSTRPLRWVFLFLLVLSTITMWYLTFSPRPEELQHLNLMYFYEYEPLYRQSNPFTLRQRWSCRDTPPFLAILVASHPRDVKARQAIRVTWGSHSSWRGHPVLTLFLLGQDTQGSAQAEELSLADESVLYGDIIQQDFLDTYDNLTLKTIMAFQWVTELCPNVRFLMKTDVDVFINVPKLVEFLLNSSGSLFTGYPFLANSAYRGWVRRRYISPEEYPFQLYPPYCSGMGYVLDGKLALRVYDLMGHVKPVKFEDVYVGICLNLLQVKVSVPEDAEQFFLSKIHFDVCKYRQLIAVHGLTPTELLRSWQELSAKNSVTCL